MDFDDLRDENLFLLEILDLLKNVKKGLMENRNTLPNYARNALQCFYDLIQSSQCYILTDDKHNINGSKKITFSDEIYYYGIKTNIKGKFIVLDLDKMVTKTHYKESLPFNRLLSNQFELDAEKREAFLINVELLVNFYQGLGDIRDKITKYCY